MEAHFFPSGWGGIIKRESLTNYQGEILTGNSYEFSPAEDNCNGESREFPRSIIGRISQVSSGKVRVILKQESQ